MPNTVRFNESYPVIEKSLALHERALKRIPCGTQMLAKGTQQHTKGVAPIYLERGKGSHVWDVDGNEYIDLTMGMGPVSLGYCYPRIDDALRDQLTRGINFTLIDKVELDVAELLHEVVPCAEMVRYAKAGCDAASAAVRIARAYTGRDKVVCSGYHGWHDWYIGTTTRDAGVPRAVAERSTAIPYADLDALGTELARGDVAAVVLEPSGATAPPPGYLEALIDATRAAGAISVFDEVITGFRLAPGGARERYGVEPDLSCYGKALGNGMPIAAVGGRWELMQVFEEIFFSGTHGGEALSLAAARAVLDTIADGTVLAGIEARGRQLLNGVTALVERHGIDGLVTVGGEPQRVVLGFGGEEPLVTKSWVQQCQAAAGCIFNGSLFTCARHTEEDVATILSGFDTAFEVIGRGDDIAAKLAGPPVAPVFRTP